MMETKNELETRTKDQFFSLIWKKDEYVDVTISDDYVVSVIHSSGLESIGTLSAGEGIILALSFMAAINTISGFDVPIVIDTPLGRIAETPRENIAKQLPGFLAGKQVVMLVTDTEYTPNIQNLLSDCVIETKRIIFQEDPQGGVSEVHTT